MPAKNLKSPKLIIKINLLHPQSSTEKIIVRLIRWFLFTYRYILVFVEAIILTAFVARFKLDADIASLKEQIDQEIPYIESLKSYEVLIKETQLKLSKIEEFYVSIPDYPNLLNKVADQTPQGVKIISINLAKSANKIDIQISATAQSNTDLLIFINGLKQDSTFAAVSLTSVGLEQGVIRFTTSTSYSVGNRGGTSL